MLRVQLISMNSLNTLMKNEPISQKAYFALQVHSIKMLTIFPDAFLDVDGSGTVDYEEFVLSVTSYCMFTRDEVLKCKKVFDKHNDVCMKETKL